MLVEGDRSLAKCTEKYIAKLYSFTLNCAKKSDRIDSVLSSGVN